MKETEKDEVKLKGEEAEEVNEQEVVQVAEEPKTEEATAELPKEEGTIEEEAQTSAEEEEKPAKAEKAEEEIVEERTYTIPLSRAWIMPANKRAPRAIRILKSYVVKHMKLGARKETEEEEEEEPSRLIINNDVNLRIWNRGIEKPPRKIRVRAAKDKDGNVTVYLAEGD